MKRTCCYFCVVACIGFFAGCGVNQKQPLKEQILEEKVKNTVFSFFGAPGAGKGTLAADCVKTLGFKVLSTGNLCRERIAKGDDVGKSIESIIKSGGLIPDELVTSMVESWLQKETATGNPIILDGYPRTQKQADLFLALLKEKFGNYKFRVIALSIPDEEIVKRLSSRLVCENKACQTPTSLSMVKDLENPTCPVCASKLIRREDDKEEIVRERLRVYAQHSGGLLKYYEQRGQKIENINASGLTIGEVFEAFKKMIEQN